MGFRSENFTNICQDLGWPNFLLQQGHITSLKQFPFRCVCYWYYFILHSTFTIIHGYSSRFMAHSPVPKDSCHDSCQIFRQFCSHNGIQFPSSCCIEKPSSGHAATLILVPIPELTSHWQDVWHAPIGNACAVHMQASNQAILYIRIIWYWYCYSIGCLIYMFASFWQITGVHVGAGDQSQLLEHATGAVGMPMWHAIAWVRASSKCSVWKVRW